MRYGALLALGMLSSSNVQAQTLSYHDWSGYYVGGDIGVVQGRASTSASTTDGFTGSYFTPPDPQQIAAQADNTLTESKLALGLSTGYGKQFEQLYLGVEASINSLSFDKTSTSAATYQSNSVAEFSHQIAVKSDWQALLRTRLGWAQQRWLGYVTGGVALTQIKLDATFSDDYLGAGAYAHRSDSEVALGWVVGLGAEYALAENWAFKAEYLYADYGSVDSKANVHNPAFPTLNNQLKSSVDFKTQILSVGMSYHF